MTTLVTAAFRGMTARQDALEKDVAALKQAHHDSSLRAARVEDKLDDLTSTVHSIDKNIAALVARNDK